MLRSIRWIVVVAIVGVLLATTTSPALAIFPKLQTKLSGPAINGVVPEGDARVDQSKLPAVPGQLQVRVKKVNLPDGTVLAVQLGATIVGTFTLSRGEGQLSTTLNFQVGRLDPIFIRNGDMRILSGGAPWQV